jgi:hypothetical protein
MDKSHNLLKENPSSLFMLLRSSSITITSLTSQMLQLTLYLNMKLQWYVAFWVTIPCLQCHNPKDHTRSLHRCENLRSYTLNITILHIQNSRVKIHTTGIWGLHAGGSMSLNGEKKRRSVMRNTGYYIYNFPILAIGQSHIPAPNPVQKKKKREFW